MGPFESGFLKPVTKDRSFNVAATPHTSVDWKSVRGVINGDKNGLFQKLRAEDSVAPGLMAVSAPNVRRAVCVCVYAARRAPRATAPSGRGSRSVNKIYFTLIWQRRAPRLSNVRRMKEQRVRGAGMGVLRAC